MKTGLSFFFMGTGKTGTDRDVYREELALAQMAEPLGFDSVLLLYSEEVLSTVGAWA